MPSKQTSFYLRWRWLGRDLLVILALATALEGTIRIVEPEFVNTIFDHEWTGAFPMDINADYYRGPLVPKTKAPSERRILALGDSVTFGTGVPSDQTFVADVSRTLQQSLGTTVTPLNSGIEGSSVRDLHHAYTDKWIAYDPDSVVIAISPNMVSMALVQPAGEVLTVKSRYIDPAANLSMLQRAKIQAGRCIHRLGLATFLSRGSQMLFYWFGTMNHNVDPKRPYGAMLAYGYLQGDLPPETGERAWALFAAELATFVQRLKADHRQVVITLIEPRFQLSDAVRDNLKHVPKERFSVDFLGQVRQLSSSLGVAFVDTTAALRIAAAEDKQAGHPTDLYLLLDFAHLNPRGHRTVAAALAPALLR